MGIHKENDCFEYIYTAKIRYKNGRVIYARSYGKKAFRIRVRRKQNDTLDLFN